jgi:hypothetical protein
MPKLSFRQQLSSGDRRSLGSADEMVAEVLRSPALFESIFAGIMGPDLVLRVRCADMAEKVTRKRPDLLQLFKRQVLDDLPAMEEPEVRWHLAQMLPRLRLGPGESERILELLFGLVRDRSKIVQVSARQSLWDLARSDAGLKDEVKPLVKANVERWQSGGESAREKTFARRRIVNGYRNQRLLRHSRSKEDRHSGGDTQGIPQARA